MKKLIFILILASAFQQVLSQADTTLKVSLKNTFSYSVIDFTTDNLGNIYILNTSNQIKKLNDKGDSIAVYNDVRRYGKIYSIDATNPLKVLVYYKDFSTIIVLDRLLNIRNTIDLRKQDIFQVKAITSSYDNNIWLFDELDSRLKKIDDNGRIIFQSTDFRMLFDKAPSPQVMYDRDNYVYLYDSAKGLLAFDYYGAQKSNIAILAVNDLQVIDKNTITGRDTKHILLYKPATLQMFSFNVFKDQSRFKKIRFDGTKIYGLSENGDVEIYSVL